MAGAVPRRRVAQHRDVSVVGGWCRVRVHRARGHSLGEERDAHRHSAALRSHGERGSEGQESLHRRIAPTGFHGVNYTPVAARRPRPSSWAFSATTTVDTDMSTAPSAGESRIPARASTPAASGMATAL